MGKRSKRILIAAALLGAIVAGGCAAAPWLLARIATYKLGQFADVEKLEIESVGLAQLTISAIEIDNERMHFAARQGVVHYDLWPLQVRGVDIQQASLTLSGLASTDRAPGTMAFVPVLPTFPLHIDELVLDTTTPWGELSLPMSIQTSSDPDSGPVATAHLDGLVLTLERPAQYRYLLALRTTDSTTLLTLTAGIAPGSPIELRGNCQPEPIVHWLRNSPLVPRTIHTALAPFRIDSNGLAFSGAVKRIDNFKLELIGGIAIHDRRPAAQARFSRVRFKSTTGYSIRHTAGLWAGSGSAAVTIAPAPDTRLSARDPAWRWDRRGIVVSATGAMLEPLGIAANSFEISSSGPGAAANGDFQSRGLRMDRWPKGLAPYDVTGHWTRDGASLQADGNANGIGLPALKFGLTLSGDRGRVEITTHDSVAALGPSLKRYTAAITPGLKIHSGTLRGHYRLTWNAENQHSALALSAGPVDAEVGGMAIRDLKIRLTNRHDSLETLEVRVSAPTLKLAAGAVATDLRAALRVSFPVVHVDLLRAELFGGSLALQPTSIDINDQHFDLVAKIEQVSLHKIMRLFDLESVKLTGAVSGPVRLVYDPKTGLAIDEGKLHSVEPGVLKFSMNHGPDAATAELDNIALRALQNFQYRTLKASLLYQPDGHYRISARIVGHNPKVLGGHAIAFNPTIEGQLPALFQAFILTGDFTQAIIERLSESQGASTPGESPLGTTSTLQGD